MMYLLIISLNDTGCASFSNAGFLSSGQAIDAPQISH